ncbi:sigma-70 family RNA polymerase sigma factor [Stieleria sp. ICT_E10.1]|uniref:RNA polymerase sigma factor n=1 Tax=Stieleria sedimenti TaxID=2976331 RepID=UPI00218089AE|nr:sigma-70 family RNA polymerase sigma factor [Stieleria sedimenti]MCS7468068.1 sigma-70 family RNA polymerase sigma factor [Stieleria sedimenti]
MYSAAPQYPPAVELILSVPETRPSILIRLRDHRDRDAWRQFVQVYRGVIRRVAIRYGLQEADASDVVQDVLIRVSKGIDGFEQDPQQAKFRTWLGQVIRSAIVDHHRRRPRKQGSGLTEVHDQLAQLADAEDQASFDQVVRRASRDEIFRWAARRIRGEFAESSWSAFWKTSVEQQSVESVAEQLGRSVGAIYTSRSRIMRRLREEVCLFDQDPMFDQQEHSTGGMPDEA